MQPPALLRQRSFPAFPASGLHRPNERLSASPQSSASDWSRRSKMVVGCHTLPIAVPVLKKSAFGLMTDPPSLASTSEQVIVLFFYYNALWETRRKSSGFVPGIRVSTFFCLVTTRQLVDGRNKPGHDERGMLVVFIFTSRTRPWVGGSKRAAPGGDAPPAQADCDRPIVSSRRRQALRASCCSGLKSCFHMAGDLQFP